MTDTFPVRPGSIALDNTLRQDTALYLKMFSGEVLGTFLKKNKFLNLTRSMNVGAGKSHQFPAIGETTAKYHERGEDIWTQGNGYITDVEHGERIIYTDKTLLSAVAIDNWDDLIKHYETRSEYSVQLGEALADKLDRQIIQSIILGSRDTATLPATQADKVGLELTDADSDVSASSMISQMVLGATHLVEKNCPMDEITFAVRPSMYYALAEEGTLIDRDFNPENGSQAEGKVLRGYGFNIIWTNNMPTRLADGGIAITQADGEFNDYSGTFNTVEAFGFHRSAVATVYRQGVVTETEKSVARQAELLVSKMVCGTGILRPECCISIKTA